MNNFDVYKYHFIVTNSDYNNLYIAEKLKILSKRNDFSANLYYLYNTTRLKSMTIYNNQLSQDDKKTMEKCPEFLGYIDAFVACLNIANLNNWPYIFIFRDDIIKIDDDFINKFNIFKNKVDDSAIIIFNDIIDYKINNVFITRQNYLNAIKSINISNCTYFHDWCMRQPNVHLFRGLIQL